MRSFHQLALLALPLLAHVAAEAPPAPTPTKVDDQAVVDALYANGNEAFQDLLNALPEESLHAALNSLTHFRDGVFESDRRGVEHIHHDNPPLASKLIVAAVEDLKKRQAPVSTNGTAPTQPPQTSNAPPSQSSQSPSISRERASSGPAVIPVTVSTTDAQGRPSTAVSEILSQPTASVVVPVTRTNAQGSTQVFSETKPAAIFSTTDSQGRPIQTTAPLDFAPTRGQVLTRTDQQGSTFLTTYTPGTRVSSVVLKTTVDAQGRPSVVTSYTYIDPAAPPTENAPGQPASTGNPSLQRGGAAMLAGHRFLDAAVLGGALAAFFV